MTKHKSPRPARALCRNDLRTLDAAAFWGRARRVGRCLEMPMKPWALSSDRPLVRVPGYGGVAASRVSYALQRGDVAAGLFVCHTCDNPRCIDPFHLFLGTHQENVDDAVRKGRMRGPTGVSGDGTLKAVRGSLDSVAWPTDRKALSDTVGERRARIVVARYGLYGTGEPATLESIARREGVTRERVRQLVEAAKRRVATSAIAS